MPKGYWIACYKSISDAEALAEYGKLAGPVLQAAGGVFKARGVASQAFEQGIKQRTVVIEFDSVDQAVAAYHSPAYQAAARLLHGKVERDVRIVEGVV